MFQNFEINEFHDFEESLLFSVSGFYTIRKPRSVFMPSKVPFQVVYCSSSDDNHREKELEVCVSFFLVFSGRFLLTMQELESYVLKANPNSSTYKCGCKVIFTLK